MKRLLPIFIAALGALIVSCNKNDSPEGNGNEPSDRPGCIPEEYGNFELAEEAVFMTEDMTSIFVSVEDGKIVFSASAPAESVPAVGTVIICPLTEKTPAGLLVKVVAVEDTASGYVLTTEPASLADAFDELHVDTVMDISPYLLHSIDNEGNITKPEIMTPEEWEEIMQESGETKADAYVLAEFTPVSFPFEGGEFKGSLYMKLAVNSKIDISRTLKVNSYEFNVTRTTGVGGGWDIDKKGEWEKTYFEKELVFRPIPIPGTPLALVPKLYAEVGAKAKGEAKFKADVNLIFERQTYSVSSTGGGTPVYTCTNEPELNENCFRFHHLTFDGQFALSVAAGGKICLYDEAVLAIGGELGGETVISASAGVSMEEEGLLIQNPEVALNLGLGASVYAESALFKLVPDNDEGRLSKDFELPLASLEMHALPAYSDLERTSSETARSISGKFEKYSMIICEEKGFAIFEEGNDTPLQHIALSKGHESGKTSNDGTKAIELPKEEGSASFSIADSETMYETRPYAKAWGKYFYGEGEVKKRLKSFYYDGDLEESYEYDESGRLCKIIYSDYNDYIRYKAVTYDSKDKIVFTSNYGEYPTSIATSDYIKTGLGPDQDAHDGSTYHLSYYNDGFLKSFNSFGSSNSPLYIFHWENENVVQTTDCYGDVLNNPYITDYIYSGDENKLNIDIISNIIFKLPALYIYTTGRSFIRELPKSAKCVSHGIIEKYNTLEEITSTDTFEYIFDEDGYVIEMIVNSRKQYTEHDETWRESYTFEYEEISHSNCDTKS